MNAQQFADLWLTVVGPVVAVTFLTVWAALGIRRWHHDRVSSYRGAHRTRRATIARALAAPATEVDTIETVNGTAPLRPGVDI